MRRAYLESGIGEDGRRIGMGQVQGEEQEGEAGKGDAAAVVVVVEWGVVLPVQVAAAAGGGRDGDCKNQGFQREEERTCGGDGGGGRTDQEVAPSENVGELCVCFECVLVRGGFCLLFFSSGMTKISFFGCC